MEVEQQRCHALQEELDEARAGQLSEHRKLDALQVALEKERQAWAQQEHQLKERCQALQEEGQAQLEREKVKAAVRRIREWEQIKGKFIGWVGMPEYEV